MLKFKALLLLLLSFCCLFADENSDCKDYINCLKPFLDVKEFQRINLELSDKIVEFNGKYLNSNGDYSYFSLDNGKIVKFMNERRRIVSTSGDFPVPTTSFVISGVAFYIYEYSLPDVYHFYFGVEGATLDKNFAYSKGRVSVTHSAVFSFYTLVSDTFSCPDGSNFNTSIEQCQVCFQGEVWDKSQNKCITGCPAGKIYDPDRKTCDEIICAAPEVLDKLTNTCKPCSENTQYDSETKSCVCKSGTFNFENRCVSTCADFEILQQRFNCVCSHGEGDKKIKVTQSSGKISGKFEGFYDKGDTIVGINQAPDTIVANYSCVAKCTVGIIRVNKSAAGDAMCSGLNLDDFTQIDLDALDKSMSNPDSAKTDKEKEEDKNKDKDKDKGGGSGKGDGKGDGSTSGDDNSKGSSGNITIGDNNKTKNPDKPGSNHSKDDPNNNGKGKDDGSKGDKGHSGSGNNNDGVGKGDFEAGIGDGDNEDYFGSLEGEFKAFDGLIGDLKGFKDMLGDGKSIPKLNSPSVPKSCPVTRKFSGTNIEAKDVTWDFCAVLAPMRDPLYFIFYLVFLIGFVVSAYKILLHTFKD